jgi:hypothetical protein
MPHIKVRLMEALYTILHTVSIYRCALAILTFIQAAFGISALVSSCGCDG